MDKRIKYSLKEKLAIVRAVKRGQLSCTSASKQLGTNLTTVRRWVNLYLLHGKAALQPGIRKYSGKFKVHVVEYMLKNRLSLMQTAVQFAIPQDYTVGKWLNKYQDNGPAALLKETKGRKASVMDKKREKKINPPSTSPVDKKLAALEAEVEYLRAENAFLKKLDALIREEDAVKVTGKQQKSSRD